MERPTTCGRSGCDQYGRRPVDGCGRVWQSPAAPKIFVAARRASLRFDRDLRRGAVHHTRVATGRVSGSNSALALLHAITKAREYVERRGDLGVGPGSRRGHPGPRRSAPWMYSPSKRYRYPREAPSGCPVCRTETLAHDFGANVWVAGLHLGVQRHAFHGPLPGITKRRFRGRRHGPYGGIARKAELPALHFNGFLRQETSPGGAG